MNTSVVPIGQARAPVAMQNRMKAGSALSSNFADGVRDSFPILSIKGKVFRIRMSGQETPLIDQQTRQAIPFLDVVLLNASRYLSKTFYQQGFEEGEFNVPDCWSLDSVRPDPSVVNKVNPTCQDCPMNVFGSAPSRDGSKRGGKACQDARRVAVMMPGHLDQAEPLVFMLRVPATSLKNLKAYAQLLERQGWEPAGCVTRLAFDYNEAYPKLVFNFVDGLDDKEYDRVVEIAESPGTAAMLQAPDFDQAATAAPPQRQETTARVRQAAPVMESQVGQAVQAAAVASAPQRRPVQQPEPEQQTTPPLKGVDEVKLIELPTGELFNPATGEFIARPAAKVDMPAIDPDVLALPDGRFFNQRTKAFVENQNVGATAPVAEAPVKRTRAPRKPKVAEGEQQPAAAAASPEGEAVDNNVENAAPEPEAKVQAAPAGLDDLIRSVFPNKK